MKTVNDLKDIAKLGGSLNIDASALSAANIKDIVKNLDSSATLILRNADSKSALELKDIAKLAPTGKVIFEL